MADLFISEIRIMAINFAPKGWVFCNGQVLPISQNTALFSLLGTTYGGDGRSTFALPNLQGRVPLHWGQGQGLSSRDLGEAGGVSEVNLTTAELPAHSHTLNGSALPASKAQPDAGSKLGATTIYGSGAPTQAMAPQMITATGGNVSHNNLQPYLTLNFFIVLQGVFPLRS
ncbi:MAG: phage tail protein [Gammaproteobacteria bacterium]|nr:phage tail protein [Gammaproteobacteria bacterium]